MLSREVLLVATVAFVGLLLPLALAVFATQGPAVMQVVAQVLAIISLWRFRLPTDPACVGLAVSFASAALATKVSSVFQVVAEVRAVVGLSTCRNSTDRALEGLTALRALPLGLQGFAVL